MSLKHAPPRTGFRGATVQARLSWAGEGCAERGGMQQADGWSCDLWRRIAASVWSLRAPCRVAGWVRFGFEAEVDVLECGETGLGVGSAGEGQRVRPRESRAWIAARRERARCKCRGGGKCLRAGSVSKQGPPNI